MKTTMKIVSGPPRKTISNLIARTRKLIKGKTVLIEVPEYGVLLSADLSWRAEDGPDLEGWEFSPMQDTTEREKKLIALIEDVYDINSIFEKYIFKSKQFKEFQLEIKQLCSEIKSVEKQFKDFDWEESILIPAETIKTRHLGN